jgi:hypothetical protein
LLPGLDGALADHHVIRTIIQTISAMALNSPAHMPTIRTAPAGHGAVCSDAEKVRAREVSPADMGEGRHERLPDTVRINEPATSRS